MTSPLGLSSDLERVIFALCEDTDTPRALSVLLLIKHKEYRQLIDLVVDPDRKSVV